MERGTKPEEINYDEELENLFKEFNELEKEYNEIDEKFINFQCDRCQSKYLQMRQRIEEIRKVVQEVSNNYHETKSL